MKENIFMKEYQFFDGEDMITFNLVDINDDNTRVTVMVTNRGAMALFDYDLLTDEIGLYYVYGVDEERIYIDDFERVD